MMPTDSPSDICIDASAVLAVLLDEPEADYYQAKLEQASQLWISPVNWWEVRVRMRTLHGEAGELRTALWMETSGVVIEPVTPEQGHIAYAAHTRYGGRPARLNFGDCFAYALAKEKGVPLLYKGGDFASTDIEAA